MTLSCYSLMGEESLLIKTDSSTGLVWGGDPRCWSHFGRFSSWVFWIIWLLQTWHSSSQIEGTVLTHWKVTISSIICHLLFSKQSRRKGNKKQPDWLSRKYQDLKLAPTPTTTFLCLAKDTHAYSTSFRFRFCLVQSSFPVTAGAIA